MTAILIVGRCDSEEDLSPPFHHCVPLLPPGSGRRSRRGIDGVAVVSAEGLWPCIGRSAVDRGVVLADGASGGGGGGSVHRSADGAGGRPR